MHLICPIIALGFLTSGFAQTSTEKFKPFIDSVVRTSMVQENAVGVAVGVVMDGKIYYNQGYGSKEVNIRKPVDSLTNFHLASISKVFVATAIMQLVEQHKISLDGKLLDYIHVNTLNDERFKEITIQQMLTHTSGIPDVNNYSWDKPKNDDPALGNYARKMIESQKLLFDPGTKWEYSNMAFEMLGHVIEKVSDKTFNAYELDKVLSRVGLSHSNFDYTKTDPDMRSSPHIKRHGKVKASKIYPYNREHGPSSTLNSCTHDMCQWILEMLQIYDDQANSYQGVLKHQTLRDMWIMKHSSFSPEDSIGLTWHLSLTPLGLCAWHSGQDLGYLSMLVIYPEQKMGIILLANGDYPEALTGIPYRIALFLKGRIKKVPLEHLRILEGEYTATNPPSWSKHPWKFSFKEVNGDLVASDGSTRFKLVPLGDNEFLFPEERVSFLFNTKEELAPGVTIGKFNFKKTE